MRREAESFVLILSGVQSSADKKGENEKKGPRTKSSRMVRV